jgi:hypothetical protein
VAPSECVANEGKIEARSGWDAGKKHKTDSRVEYAAAGSRTQDLATYVTHSLPIFISFVLPPTPPLRGDECYINFN